MLTSVDSVVLVTFPLPGGVLGRYSRERLSLLGFKVPFGLDMEASTMEGPWGRTCEFAGVRPSPFVRFACAHWMLVSSCWLEPGQGHPGGPLLSGYLS